MSEPGAAAHRYAVYYAPAPDSVHGRAGAGWLGRCAAGGPVERQAPPPGFAPAEFAEACAAPRRYGWHATLKPPFALARGQDLPALRRALQALAAQLRPIEPLTLRVAQLGDFLALRPAGANVEIDALARRCVEELHGFAAALDPAELQRRRSAGLSPAQEALLLRWGYPHVMEQYRFHMTLSGTLGRLDGPRRDSLMAAASARFDGLPAWRIDALALFAEPSAGADFRLLERFEFGG